MAKHCDGVRTTVSIREPLFYINFRFEKEAKVYGENQTFAIDYAIDWKDFRCEFEQERAEATLIRCVRLLHEKTALMAREGNIVNES